MATPPLFLTDLVPPAGADTVLAGPEGRHAASVRRLRPGETLLLGDGRGTLAECVVAEPAGRDALRLAVRRRWLVPAVYPRVVLVQALVKGDRGELAVELATEAGADAVLPWRAARSIARWDAGERGARALDRWRLTAREAAKQSRRAWLPVVDEPVDTAGLVARIASAAGAMVLHESASLPLSAGPLPAAGDLAVVVGPEGGIDEQELRLLVAAGAVPVRLGPSVLRASTAGAVALGALGVLTDRWALAQTSELT